MSDDETIQVCPWTVSVSGPHADPMSAETKPFMSSNICNQVSGQMLTVRFAPGQEASVAQPILDHVAMIERASRAYIYLAWDRSADDLVAAMKALGANFAPGYGADVPVIIQA